MLREIVHMRIRDLGSGFNPYSPRTGIGLASMQEGLRMIGGDFILSSAPGHGTEIVAQVKLAQTTAIGTGS
jgi:signal transduction histidine kinase